MLVHNRRRGGTMRLYLLAAALTLAAHSPMPAIAHGGGLNAHGGHNDRKNGGYHCHRGSPGPSAKSSLSSGGSGGSTYYANCTAARAAGAAPVRSGDPGYNSKLDRDGDGVGCE